MAGSRSHALFLIEDLDLAVFVRNTFIEVAPVVQGSEICRSRSEPQLTKPRIDTETSENDIESDSVDEHQCQIWQAHCANTCRPCIFINRKKDGCRKGNLCSHCHFCTPAEAKRRRNRLCAERRQAANV
mmetsp:Transcript_26513/g.62064  ORF Transcript_26513/g.62064 Transcript_26513/m.62064 type:complete len:129 (-) Transcript_26513:238-624(-)